MTSSKRSCCSSNSEAEARAAIRNAAVTAVGKVTLTDAVRLFRWHLVEVALHQENGSRRGAARTLGLTRQAIQNLLRQSDEGSTSLSGTDGASERPPVGRQG
jgi:transcriptional regulator with GAF, ATPase, and Fis domain